jgi:hypothetical protein
MLGQAFTRRCAELRGLDGRHELDQIDEQVTVGADHADYAEIRIGGRVFNAN